MTANLIPDMAILAATVALASCAQPATPATPEPTPSAPAPAGPAVAKPPAPAFKPGMAVSDRTGARIGVIQSLTETPGGLNVVVEIDGKLVGVLPSTLQLRGESVVSSQTRAQILATAGAPR